MNKQLVKIFVVVLLMLYFLPSLVCQEQTVIPIKEINNKSLISVRFGGFVIDDLLLDTGFTSDGILIYNPDYKDSIDLSNAVEINLGGAGTGPPQKALMIDSTEFTVGGLTLKNQRIIILLSDIYRGFPSNGIIGNSLFGHFITELDYDKGLMVLHDQENFMAKEGWTPIPIYFKGNNIPWLNAKVVIEDGSPIELSIYIDYGARDNIVLLEKPGMKFSLPKETEDYYIGRGLSGDIYGKKGVISKVIIDQFEIESVQASITSADVRSKQDNADAIFGVGLLRKFNLIFDYAGKMLYIKPNKNY